MVINNTVCSRQILHDYFGNHEHRIIYYYLPSIRQHFDGLSRSIHSCLFDPPHSINLKEDNNTTTHYNCAHFFHDVLINTPHDKKANAFSLLVPVLLEELLAQDNKQTDDRQSAQECWNI